MSLNSTLLSTTGARLLFFGGRYVSLLLVARMMGVDAAGFLLALAVVETLRVVFDYGLENSLLARFHQNTDASGVVFSRGKGIVRLGATALGQIVATSLIGLFCLRNHVDVTIPLIASLQFSCLMGFGYFQAHIQTAKDGSMAALVPPLLMAALAQTVLLLLSSNGAIPVWIAGISFELFALFASAYVTWRIGALTAPASLQLASSYRATGLAVLQRIAPLGNVALISVMYNRLDAFAVSWVGSGILLTQYMLYQRLTSAPLMFFSTVASASISTLSGFQAGELASVRKIRFFRQVAYSAGVVCGIIFLLASPLINNFFSLRSTSVVLLVFQSIIVAVQIANGFHASILIALGRLRQLWRIARNNGVVALVALPLLAMQYGIIGVAGALCIIEIFCAIQHAFMFRPAKVDKRELHA
ncbi:MAG: putative rane protein [Massilia sp.]|nr:putative rane protein [Massilia sp.]